MIISRTGFFLLLFVVVVIPWWIPKIIWIAGSQKTKGTMEFVGHSNWGSVLGMSTYPVIQFKVGARVFHFNGNSNIPLAKGQKVEVRFQNDNPEDAIINSFMSIWGQTIAIAMGPVLVYIVLLVSPAIVPWRARLKIGWPSIVQIVG